jgi:hypothetical protein
MTLALTFMPCVAPMTPILTSAPCTALTTHPATSSTVSALSSAAQPVPRLLPPSVVPVSPVVHPHPMRTVGLPASDRSPFHLEICSSHSHRSSLVGSYGGRVQCLHVERHLGLGFAPPQRQCCYQRVDIQTQVLRGFT